ncbi:unnamed protein product, partial [Brassica oleracea]
ADNRKKGNEAVRLDNVRNQKFIWLMIDQHSNQNIMTVSGCDDCDSYSKKQYYNLYLLLKQKNTRSMRKAILLSKRTLAHKGSTSQTEENPILACSKCG